MRRAISLNFWSVFFTWSWSLLDHAGGFALTVFYFLLLHFDLLSGAELRTFGFGLWAVMQSNFRNEALDQFEILMCFSFFFKRMSNSLYWLQLSLLWMSQKVPSCFLLTRGAVGYPTKTLKRRPKVGLNFLNEECCTPFRLTAINKLTWVCHAEARSIFELNIERRSYFWSIIELA
jgi:hypothetical protein